MQITRIGVVAALFWGCDDLTVPDGAFVTQSPSDTAWVWYRCATTGDSVPVPVPTDSILSLIASGMSPAARPIWAYAEYRTAVCRERTMTGKWRLEIGDGAEMRSRAVIFADSIADSSYCRWTWLGVDSFNRSWRVSLFFHDFVEMTQDASHSPLYLGVHDGGSVSGRWIETPPRHVTPSYDLASGPFFMERVR